MIHHFLSIYSIYCLIWLSSISIGIAQTKSPNKLEDLQISSELVTLSPSKVQVLASSTQKGFDPDHLLKNIGWKAWGSTPTDRKGAWLNFQFDRTYYVSMIYWMPGDHRELSFFKKCGRPAKVELISHTGRRYVIQLPNQKKLQVIQLETPMITRSLKLVFKTAYGPSIQAGICMSALNLYVHKDPLKSIAGLNDTMNRALHLLDDPFTFDQGATLIQKVSHVVGPSLLQKIKMSRLQKKQAKLLNLLGQVADIGVQQDLRAIKSEIHILNLNLYHRTLASLGDQSSIKNLLLDLEKLSVKSQALRLEAIARTAESRYLDFILQYFGNHAEIDILVTPLIRYFQNSYQLVRHYYNKATGQKKAAFLSLLGAIDIERSDRLIRQALNQKDNPMLKSGGIRAAQYTHNKNLRARIRTMTENPYVIVRKAVATVMSKWKSTDDYQGLRVLAMDKSMSVRLHALRGLQYFKQGHDLLKTYALRGGDGASAETAAWSWLQGQTSKNIEVPMGLLQSDYKSVRKIGGMEILKYKKLACIPVSELLLKQKENFQETEKALRLLWTHCAHSFLQYTSQSESIAKIRALELIRYWQADEGLEIVKDNLHSSNFQVRNAAVKTLLALAQKTEGRKVLLPLLSDSSELVRCQVLKALAQLNEAQVIPIIKKTLEKYQRSPDFAKKTVMCHLKAVELLQSEQFASILERSYHAWRRSITFGKYRLAVLKAMRKIRHPKRLSLFMEAMSDIDPKVRLLAEEALKDRY